MIVDEKRARGRTTIMSWKSLSPQFYNGRVEDSEVDDRGVPEGCCLSCATARADECVCRCGGAFHGILVTESGTLDPYLSPEEARPFLDAIEDWECRWCKSRGKPSSLRGRGIQRYPHTGGWKVPGYPELQWLYITCACGYQWNLHKLGVKR